MDTYPKIPGYRIENKLGQGRLADVYQAVNEGTGQNVVIKVLLNELIQAENQQFSQCFLEEAQIASKLDHPNIVKIIDVGIANDYYYFVSEYLPENLRMRIVNMHLSSGFESGRIDIQSLDRSVPDVDIHEITEMFRQLLDALDYAHQRKIIHGDIRPENIFFKADDVFVTPIIADFCIQPTVLTSKIMKERGLLVRDPHYTCPETILKIPTDYSSDLYNLGITLFEMLTGHVPYDAEDKHALEKLHVEAPIPKLPGELSCFQPLLDRMLAKDAGERAGSAAELMLMLEILKEDILLETSTDDIDELEEIGHEVANTEDHKKIESNGVDINFAVENTAASDIAIDNTAAKNIKTSMEPGIGQEISMTADIEEKIEETKTENTEIGEEFRKNMNMQIDRNYEFPDQEKNERRPSHPFDERMKSPTLAAPDEEGLLSKLKTPRVFIPAAAAIIIIIILAIVFLLPKNKIEPVKPGEAETGQEISDDSGKPSPGESTDTRYKRNLKMAERGLAAGDYEKALQQINEAEKIKSTPEVAALKQQIQEKFTEKQEDTVYKDALKNSNIASLEEYLNKYPTGRHATEIREKLSVLNEIEKKRSEDRRKWAASRVILRSTSQTLDKSAVKDLVKKRGFFEKYYNSNGNFINHYEEETFNNQKVVVDYATGLMWHQSGSITYMKYDQIQSWLRELNQQKYAGFSDWRLPTLEEAASLMESQESPDALYIDSVFSKDQNHIWTADKFSESKAWAVDIYGGDFNAVDTGFDSFVRPVRKIID